VVVLRQKPKPKGRFSGTSWVFTGTLQEFSREEAATKVKNLGAEVSSTVSQKTTYVVAGEDPGSKYDKAKSIGVNVMNEQEFMKILKS
jgi:DNA ligase (NAD+)